MSTDPHGPRELATQLADAARALRTSLDSGPRDAAPVLSDLIATQGLITQMYEQLAAWQHLEAGVAARGDTSAAVTATRLERAAQHSELAGVWLDSALQSAAGAPTRANAA